MLHRPEHNLSTSQAACTRAIAANASLTTEETSPARIFALAEIDITPQATDITLERGANDAVALTAHLHDAKLHQKHRPNAAVAALLYDEMERVRCEAAGIGWMLGVANNLQALWHHKTRQSKYFKDNPTEQLLLVFSYLTRHALKLPCDLSEHTSRIIEKWQEPVLSASANSWAALAPLKNNQPEFLTVALDIISSINEDTATQATTPSVEDQKSVPENPEDQSEEESTEADDNQSTDDTKNRDEEQDIPDTEPSEEHSSVYEEDTTSIRDEAANTDSEHYGNSAELTPAPYTHYSSSFDEIVYARNLCSSSEAQALRNTLDEHIQAHAKIVGKLAGQLQRLLMANQNRHWQFDLEEGLLDASRLSRIITQPYTGLSFKRESDLKFKDTVVTLLVDNSKSMLGKPIAIAAACADILSRTLERCGISVEILGFTTTELHGGPLLRQWIAGGRTKDPGRLNGLRHIIYKSADVPYRKARAGLGVMLDKDLLKQNIDGEALLWAGNRLRNRPEERKILLVISDGAPIDTSTMSANPQNYLAEHLHQVIESIEKTKQIELAAIGIGHDVTKFYERAITIRDPKDLGKTLLSQFRSLFPVISTTKK